MNSSAEKYTKKEAIKQVRESRATGWPKAHMQQQPDGLYIISVHAKNCRCGRCPVIRVDGYVN